MPKETYIPRGLEQINVTPEKRDECANCHNDVFWQDMMVVGDQYNNLFCSVGCAEDFKRRYA